MKFKVLAAVLLAVLLLFYFLPQPILHVKTAAVLINLLLPEGRLRPLEVFTKELVETRQEIAVADGKKLTLYFYTPEGAKPKSAVVFYTPLIGEGPQHPRLRNLLLTFAKSGFVVLIPWRSEKERLVSPSDAEDVISAAQFLLNDVELKIEKLGLFGLSYGAGPIIVAAADPRISKDVDFVVSFAGYYDLKSAAQFVMTGEFEYNDIKGKLAPESYAQHVLKESIKQYGLSEEEFFESIVFEELRQKMSPSAVTSRLRAEFFIVHSTDDRYIPYTESMRLHDALKDRVPTHFALTTIFEHGDYKPLTWQNFKNVYLPSVTDFYNFLSLILTKTR
jgi:dipeptidyl aminopeptidase/acylaminoacyl peptidase